MSQETTRQLTLLMKYHFDHFFILLVLSLIMVILHLPLFPQEKGYEADNPIRKKHLRLQPLKNLICMGNTGYGSK
jgi:hypothetical protein